jgi:hypothetical protein
LKSSFTQISAICRVASLHSSSKGTLVLPASPAQ